MDFLGIGHLGVQPVMFRATSRYRGHTDPMKPAVEPRVTQFVATRRSALDEKDRACSGDTLPIM